MHQRRSGFVSNAEAVTGAPSSGSDRYFQSMFDEHFSSRLTESIESDEVAANAYVAEDIEAQSAELKILFLFRHDPDLILHPEYKRVLEHMLSDVNQRHRFDGEESTYVEINGADPEELQKILISANEASLSHDPSGLAEALHHYYKVYDRHKHEEELERGEQIHKLAELDDAKGLSVRALF